MAILFPSPVFGPVRSRRLGTSLGVNLLPADGKICSFNCIYCECGLNDDHRPHAKFPTREEVRDGLRAKLVAMHAEGLMPDVITFAGNGEPTLHPDFAGVIGDTLALRDELCPQAKVSVLSNATQILRQDVFDALLRVDNNILKLDTVSPGYIRAVDRPVSRQFDLDAIIARMEEYGSRCIVQTMFIRGTHEGRDVCNTSDAYVRPWLATVARIAPSEVMIYTIERETPLATLRKAMPSELDAIGDRVRALGIPCQVSY